MAANYRCKIVEKADSNADSWAKHKRKKEEVKVCRRSVLTHATTTATTMLHRFNIA